MDENQKWVMYRHDGDLIRMQDGGDIGGIAASAEIQDDDGSWRKIPVQFGVAAKMDGVKVDEDDDDEDNEKN